MVLPLITLTQRQNGRYFVDAIFKCTFVNENVWIPIKISLKVVPKGPINNTPALVQIMSWRHAGDKPLSEPMMISLPTHICVTRPQWVIECIMCSDHLDRNKTDWLARKLKYWNIHIGSKSSSKCNSRWSGIPVSMNNTYQPVPYIRSEISNFISTETPIEWYKNNIIYCMSNILSYCWHCLFIVKYKARFYLCCLWANRYCYLLRIWLRLKHSVDIRLFYCIFW